MELRTCPVCGKKFKPKHHNHKLCSPECALERKRQRDRNFRREHADRIRAQKHEYYEEHKCGRRKSKPDTIVAIGYAERQIANSLERAGRINTEL